MKYLVSNFMLGVVLALPAVIFAQAPPGGGGAYPVCCTKCDGAATCPACKADCTSQCPGDLANCDNACDEFSPGCPCAD